MLFTVFLANKTLFLSPPKLLYSTLFHRKPTQAHTSPQRCVGLLYLCIVFRLDRIMNRWSVYQFALSFNGSKRDKTERLCA